MGFSAFEMTPSRGERGQSLVELALVMPLLLLLTMGVVDVGRIYFTQLALDEAAHEGAIYGSFRPSDTTGIRTRVNGSSNYAQVMSATVTQTCTAGLTPGTPGTIAVKASSSLDLLTPVVSQILGDSVTVSATFTGTIFDGACPP